MSKKSRANNKRKADSPPSNAGLNLVTMAAMTAKLTKRQKSKLPMRAEPVEEAPGDREPDDEAAGDTAKKKERKRTPANHEQVAAIVDCMGAVVHDQPGTYLPRTEPGAPMPKQPLKKYGRDDDLNLGALWKELKKGQKNDPRVIAVWKELDGRGWGWTWEEFVAFIEEHRQWKKEEHDLLVSAVKIINPLAPFLVSSCTSSGPPSPIPPGTRRYIFLSRTEPYMADFDVLNSASNMPRKSTVRVFLDLCDFSYPLEQRLEPRDEPVGEPVGVGLLERPRVVLPQRSVAAEGGARRPARRGAGRRRRRGAAQSASAAGSRAALARAACGAAGRTRPCRRWRARGRRRRGRGGRRRRRPSRAPPRASSQSGSAALRSAGGDRRRVAQRAQRRAGEEREAAER